MSRNFTLDRLDLPPRKAGSTRILQTSDWHIGNRQQHLKQERAAKRRELLLQWIEQIPQVANQCSVDVILLPGDLFHSEDTEFIDVERVVRAIEACKPIPVIIAAGNHDPLSVLQLYRTRLSLRKQDVWFGAHVRVATGEWARFEYDRFAVTSRSFQSLAAGYEAALKDAPRPVGDRIELLCLHASLGDLPEGQQTLAPLRLEELEYSGYDYAALGHYHRGYLFESRQRIIAGYAGSFSRQRRSDTGDTGILICDVESGGVSAEKVFRIVPDPMRIIKLDVECSNTDSDLTGKIIEHLTSSGATEEDFLRVRLTGSRSLDGSLMYDEESILKRCCGFDLTDDRKPAWDYESLAQGEHGEAIFLRHVKSEREAAVKARDEAGVAHWDAVLDLGLQAFYQKKIEYFPGA